MFEDYFFTNDKDSIFMTNSMYTFLQLLDYSYNNSNRKYIYEMNHNFEESDNFGVVEKRVGKYKGLIRYADFIETFKLLF